MDPSFLSTATPAADGGPALKVEFPTLNHLLWHSLDAHGQRPLFGTKTGGEWSWLNRKDFCRLVHRMIGGLLELGVGYGDRVAIIAANRLEWAVCAYATYGLGAVYVPMYETQTDKDWEYILRDSRAKVLFTANGNILRRVQAFSHALPELRHLATIDRAGDALSYEELLKIGDGGDVWFDNTPGGSLSRLKRTSLRSTDLATLIYTSGTTGEPKGVMLTHGNITSNITAVKDLFPIGTEDRSLSFLPWAHSFGHTVELHLMLAIGASIAICEGVEKLVANLAETQPTILFAVPKIFNKIYAGVQKQVAEKPAFARKIFADGLAAAKKKREQAAFGLGDRLRLWTADKLVFAKIRQKFGGRLRFAVSGGAALSREVAEFVDSLGIEVYEGYGLTETSPIVSTNTPGRRKLGSVGHPVAGVRVVTGQDGELVVYGPNVMAGYHNQPESTAQVMTADGGFRTGDMGRIDETGLIFITGRIKEQYKLENGKYVVPSPLEEQLKLSPFITNVMIYGDNRPHNVALIVPDREALAAWAQKEGVTGTADDKVRELFAAEIRRCSSEFKGYEKVLNFALVLEDFTQENDLLTPSLKLKRRKVIERYGKIIESLYEK